MRFERRIIVRTRERLRDVLDSFKGLMVSEGSPLEIIVRTPRKEKTAEQRGLWHVTMDDLAPQLGLTPGQTKQLIKSEFYGTETRTVAGRQYEFVQSSEDSDREQYSALIDFTMQFAAEQGIYLPDRRTG